MSDELETYIRLACEHPILSKERETELGELIKLGRVSDDAKEQVIGREAAKTLAEHNLKLAVNRARAKWTPDGPGLWELVLVANLGLVEAARSFDPDLGRFSTHAYCRIDWKFVDYISGLGGDEIGRANVLEVYPSPSAERAIRRFSCHVTKGVVRKHSRARIVHLGMKAFEADIVSLQYLGEEVSEVRNKIECTATIECDIDCEIAAGDRVVCYPAERMVSIHHERDSSSGADRVETIGQTIPARADSFVDMRLARAHVAEVMASLVGRARARGAPRHEIDAIRALGMRWEGVLDRGSAGAAGICASPLAARSLRFAGARMGDQVEGVALPLGEPPEEWRAWARTTGCAAALRRRRWWLLMAEHE